MNEASRVQSSSLGGRVVLVTGGGKGIGAAIAARLHADGARVAVLGRDRMALERFAREHGGLAVEADVTDMSAVREAILKVERAWGAIEVLVQNAGISASAPINATEDAVWDRMFAVNVTAPFRIARLLIPRMIAAQFGRVVHVASNAGLTGYAYTSAYTASKHALVGLTRALAAEVAKSGVTVNAVCPGFVDTEMASRAIAQIAESTGRTSAEARASLEAMNPQRRLVTANEVAHVVAMLCDPRANGINGQAIPIDGGQVMS